MSDGALLDLVSRGRKDTYFTSPTAARSWFSTSYERRSGSTRDVRFVYPEAPARFGGWVDIELPRAGDILMEAEIRIRMPTWLPGDVVRMNNTHAVTVESRDWPGTFLHYGWTNGIANYLVRRWALYADTALIVDGYGAFNSWFPDMNTTHFQAPLLHESTGTHTGTARAIQRAATPASELVFRVPLMGCQGDRDVGLPLCALKGQRLYVRLWLAPMEELVESSLKDMSGGLPVYEVCPEPWGGRAIRINGAASPYVTLPDYEIGQPQVYGRFAVLNLEDEVRRALSAVPHSIPFRRQAREDFILAEGAFAPTTLFKRRLDIYGYFQALFVGITSTTRLRQNKYRDIMPPGGGEWLTELSLNVNGQERIQSWPAKKFRELAMNTQLRRDVETAALYYLVFGVSPYRHEPAGCCDLTRTQKVLLNMRLEAVPADPATGSTEAAATVMGLSWNVFDIRDGAGRLRFTD